MCKAANLFHSAGLRLLSHILAFPGLLLGQQLPYGIQGQTSLQLRLRLCGTATYVLWEPLM